MISIFAIVTYPIILLGLFRGSWKTYKSLNTEDVSIKREQLEYWVVMIALLFIFPWIDSVLSLFLFSGFVGLVKLILLISVVVSKSNYGFMYKLIEEQFMSFVEPYIQIASNYFNIYKRQICNIILPVVNSIHQFIIIQLMDCVSDDILDKLKRRITKTLSVIKREQIFREKNDNNVINHSQSQSNSNISNQSSSNNINHEINNISDSMTTKSIFEQAQETAGNDGLRARQRTPGKLE